MDLWAQQHTEACLWVTRCAVALMQISHTQTCVMSLCAAFAFTAWNSFRNIAAPMTRRDVFAGNVARAAMRQWISRIDLCGEIRRSFQT
jgi:hypothetical protein